MTAIREWLETVGLVQHADLFEREQIDLDAVRHLTESNLKDLGLGMGPRVKLLAAIQALPAVAASGAAKTPPTEHAPEAERRQLTVLFCDLVGYTELASRLDPEVLQGIVRRYEDTCAAAITRYEGYVFQRLGDGIVAFFGYPLAHEGEAERAIRAGLTIIESLSKLDLPEVGHLQLRLGIATGLVVVSSAEKGAVGETMNLAARLQAIAQPGSIVVSERVHRLAGGAFDYEDLGEQTLKGIAKPAPAYRILGLSEAASRFDAAHGEAGLTPLVGRGLELGLLLERWALAQDGEGQVVLLSGEPGIGKSRILTALHERLQAQGTQALRFQCSPYYINSAFWPSIDNFERALRFARNESAEAKLDKLEALIVTRYGRPLADVRFIAAMLSIGCEERYGPTSMTPQKHKDETLRSLVDLTEAAARTQPSVMLFEDLHWADPTTLEVLDLLVDRVRNIPLLIVLTHRPEFHSRWSQHGHVAAVNLSKLTRAQSAAMVAKLAGKPLPAELKEHIVGKTDGVPLFVEELTKSILESGELKDLGDRYEYAGSARSITIPATLRDSLMARLDRYMPVKEIAQIGAAIGREFSHELISAVAPMPQAQLDDALGRLTESGLAFGRGTPPDAVYTFKHALVQDAAYDSLLKSRRQELHAKIARVIEERFAELKDSEPEVLAHHLTQAGLNERAVPYWMRAGQRALERVALSEAVGHLTAALDVNNQLPASAERDQKELDIRVLLATAYLAQRGWAAVEIVQALEPARALAQRLEKNDQLAAILWYIGNHYGVRCDYSRKLEINQQLDALATSRANSIAYVVARFAELHTHCWMGNFSAARNAGDRLLAAYDPARHAHLIQIFNHDLECDTLLWAGIWLWALGYPDQAKETILRQLQLARRLDHPFQLAWALIGGAWPLLWRGETSLVLELLAEGRAIALENGLGYLANVAVAWTEGLALIERGDCVEGYAKLTPAVRAWHDAGGRFLIPWWDAQRACALMTLGRELEARALLDEALAISDETGHRFWEAESHRGLGELLQRQQPVADLRAAEGSFSKALEVARAQEAKGFELRAAMSLARLWEREGKRRDARDLLAPIYNWFTEGFDTKDLKEAKALLDELES